MNILGICNGETSSACLMIDGKIISAASEERFSRIKMDKSFPLKSIQFCLTSSSLLHKDIDVVSYAWAKGFKQDLHQQYLDRINQLKNDLDAKKIAADRKKWEIFQDKKNRKGFEDWVDKNIDTTKTIVKDYYHHEAHAASAAYFSQFNNGVVMTCDGRGDFESATISDYNRFALKPLTKIYSASSIDSIGYFYGRITGLLGFMPGRHEGKITGLAAYGDSKAALDLCKKMIDVENGVIKSSLGKFYSPFFQPYSSNLEEEIKNYKREDVAASAQHHIENMMCSLLDFHLEKGNYSNINLMLAGGVFANVKVTQKLKELRKVKSIYVQPQMGDGGLCLGAAALANEELFTKSRINVKTRLTQELKSMFLGPNISSIPSKNKSDFHFEDIEFKGAPKKLASVINNNIVVGFIQGRMEFGPRALCNRSILYKTSDSKINDWLNKRLRREEFMPFAPVIREEVAHDVIKEFDHSDVSLKFMTSTVRCTDSFILNSPATVHIDGTARPQIVSKESNLFIWHVLKEWEDLSGELALVNTSFNAHEEPIICDETEGLNSLKNNCIDELWVIYENNKIRRYSNKSL
jgi:carbamoyltransferase